MKSWLINILKGAAIGIACIVPGVSGGTLAVILNVYDKILESVSNLRKEFKKSISFLWPIILGIVLGLAAMVYPLKKAIEYFPLPTVMLFVGFIVGSMPSLFEKVNKKHKPTGLVSLVLATLIPIGLCFISAGKDVNLSSSMEWYMYLLIILIGILASCALTIPGISGSMLLLILGFFNPILETITNLIKFNDLPLVGHSLLVLLLFGIGIIIGFILISKIMTYLLKKFNYLTFMAIIGFIIGSLFAIFYAIKDDMFPGNSNHIVHIIIGIILLIVGGALSLCLYLYSKKLENLKKEHEQKDEIR